MCAVHCTIVAHNTAQNRPDNFLSCPPDDHHCFDDVYLRESLTALFINFGILPGLGTGEPMLYALQIRAYFKKKCQYTEAWRAQEYTNANPQRSWDCAHSGVQGQSLWPGFKKVTNTSQCSVATFQGVPVTTLGSIANLLLGLVVK